MNEDDIEEIYIAYLLLKGRESSDPSISKTEKRAIKQLKRIINKYGTEWKL